ncbi:MAG: hypothetical protein DWQ34_12645 [Planctomycetota bacterium]|nr:MAG: hypothetical protein DWQ34_12645 [Planctomycetota bacterium]REK25557.1 MAG: hypothetical protein DWQ41_11490 [Planctomycetota bacterium]REK31731.1 MAG: hypothetical protein DWQ45_19195 [Planctomycetota bacterium]
MSVYIITARDEAELSSPIFAAGDVNPDESAAAFTTQLKAEEYLEAAGWRKTDVVVELDSESMLDWIAALRSDGVESIAVDPDRRAQESGARQAVISLHGLTAELAGIIERRIHTAPPPAGAEELQRIDIYCCQACGQVVEQLPEKEPPTCCDREMELSAFDTVRPGELREAVVAAE